MVIDILILCRGIHTASRPAPTLIFIGHCTHFIRLGLCVGLRQCICTVRLKFKAWKKNSQLDVITCSLFQYHFQWLNRKTERSSSHTSGIYAVHCHNIQILIRLPRRWRVLVYCRCGLDYRTQLHYIRPHGKRRNGYYCKYSSSLVTFGNVCVFTNWPWQVFVGWESFCFISHLVFWWVFSLFRFGLLFVFSLLFLMWMGRGFIILHGQTTHGKLLEPKNLFTPSQTKQIWSEF